MRVAIFSVKYSPNLGDGLLSECLERELIARRPGWSVVSADLAGRAGYGEADTGRRAKLLVLEALPSRLRALVARVALRRLVDGRLRPRWRQRLANADAVIVGGGNLFADADLNFPTKIAGALDEARARGLPVAVFAVGVTPNWSRRGKALFGNALERARLRFASVRDERSRAGWGTMLAGRDVASPTIVLDPGLLASRHYPQASVRADRTIAFGITDPLAVHYHAPGTVTGHDLIAWYAEAIGTLVEAGYRVTLFTNGSPEDRSFLARHEAAFVAGREGRVSVAPGFNVPADMATFLSGHALVVAHRMHACIAAHSFAVPTIGLAWDVKLNSFFEIVGRAGYMLDPASGTAGDVAVLAHRAIEEGVPPEALDRLIVAAGDGVEALAGAIEGDTA
jgi:polysaccharide pyruvyl transferase WcaK-like protein